MSLFRKTWWLALVALFLMVVFYAGVRFTTPGSKKPAPPPEVSARGEHLEHYAVIVHLLQTVRWLDTASVQEELALSADQVEAVCDCVAKSKQDFSGFRTVPPEQREIRIRDEWLPKAEAMEARLQQLFTPDQRRRLRQIIWQKQLGAIALLVPQAAEALQLDESQRREIEALVAETLAESDRQGTGMLGLWNLAETAKEARRRAMDTLTPKQREEWKTLLGEPF